MKKASPTIGTKIHAADHSVIAEGTALDLGSVVHDTAQVGGAVGSITPTGAVTFTFYSGADCTSGSSIATANAVDSSSGDPRSVDTSALAGSLCGARTAAPQLRRFIADGIRIAASTLVLYEWWRGPRLPDELRDQEALFPRSEAVA